MNGPFDIQKYMTNGVERVVSEALKATLKDPRESAELKTCGGFRKITEHHRMLG